MTENPPPKPQTAPTPSGAGGWVPAPGNPTPIGICGGEAPAKGTAYAGAPSHRCECASGLLGAAQVRIGLWDCPLWGGLGQVLGSQGRWDLKILRFSRLGLGSCVIPIRSFVALGWGVVLAWICGVSVRGKARSSSLFAARLGVLRGRPVRLWACARQAGISGGAALPVFASYAAACCA
jgi:hypothetical protein